MRNLSNMRAFYIAFPNWNAMRSNLSWTHYRMILKVEDEVARAFIKLEYQTIGTSNQLFLLSKIINDLTDLDPVA